MTYPHKWEKEWYTTWYTRKNNPNTEGEKKKERARKREKRSKRKKKSKRSRRNREEVESEDEIVTPEIPEIGNLYSLRFRGEKASRVHLHFVSYLSKSRWKQKYFPRGIFSQE